MVPQVVCDVFTLLVIIVSKNTLHVSASNRQNTNSSQELRNSIQHTTSISKEISLRNVCMSLVDYTYRSS